MDNQSHDELEIGRRQSGFPGKAGNSDAIAGLQKAASRHRKRGSFASVDSKTFS